MDGIVRLSLLRGSAINYDFVADGGKLDQLER